MENQVDDIKKKLDIVEVINHYLPLNKRGRHFIACCPFHGEKTPSFTVSPELQIFKCFGCGKAGDIFTFVQEYEHVEFKDALQDLAKMAGITLIRSAQLNQADSQRKRLIDLNYQTAKFYNYILTTHPLGKPALDYVTSRGITADTIHLFRLGFSPTNATLVVNYLQKQGFTIPELISSGTFGKSQYYNGRLYDRFQDRLVFPLADYRNQVVGFSGRILPSKFQTKTGYQSKAGFEAAKYINSPETDIYHKSQMLYGLNLAKESIKKTNAVVIVEGEFDMISPYQIGVTNVVAIKGTAFTAEQLQLLHRYTDTLILSLDSDFAGNNAARKSIELADSMEFDIKVLSLGEKYKDPDEAIKADPEFFKDQFNHLLPIWDYIIASAFKTYDVTTIKGKKDILNMVLPFLVKINNSVTQLDYYNKFAAQLGSSVEAIIQEANKHHSSPVSVIPTAPLVTSDPSISKTERLEDQLLTLILSAKKPAILSQKISSQIEFSTPRFQKIFLHLTGLVSNFEPKLFADSLSPELVASFQNLYLASTYLNLDSHQRLIEIKKTISQILSLSFKQQLIDLSSQIARAEAINQETMVKTLEMEYNKVLTKLAKIQSAKS